MARGGRGGSDTSVDNPSPTRAGDDGDPASSRRTPDVNAADVDGGHDAVQARLAAGRVGNASAGSAGGPGSTTRSPVASTVTGEQLPPGYSYDVNGRLHGPDGGYARDPTAPPGAHNRDTEYPAVIGSRPTTR
ncbi:hypothetical protein Ari01nite_97670 [Paractinoplanes rishiriensis]|uniref:Uncharacterized protein n=1 Tax=Paractinoplanes rishiriensis TaxID=1050105 RepID=A0A919KA65_9ACTN|nr:hypothetical protein Ari01nite_97670 [Actinoplanes rishiriensis]